MNTKKDFDSFCLQTVVLRQTLRIWAPFDSSWTQAVIYAQKSGHHGEPHWHVAGWFVCGQDSDKQIESNNIIIL